MAVSINEIAEKCGVSCATVSRVFRSSGYVSPKTREHILAVAASLNYQPKKYKSRTNSSVYNSVVGIVVSDLETYFYPKAIKGVMSILSEKGIDLLICDTNDDSSREIRCLEMLRSKHVNGIILSPVADNIEFNNTYIEELSLSGIPVVLLDRSLKGISLDGVFRDDFSATTMAVQCLVDNGHRDIAIIAGLLNSKPGLDRLNGYLSVMRSNNLFNHHQNVFYGDFKTESGYTQTQIILREHPEVTAIFCSNNMMTNGCLRAVSEARLSIPEDISVVAFGDIESSYQYSSTITAVTQPIYPLGEECARILLEKMAYGKRGRMPARRVTFESRLILRGSEKYPENRKEKGE